MAEHDDMDLEFGNARRYGSVDADGDDDFYGARTGFFEADDEDLFEVLSDDAANDDLLDDGVLSADAMGAFEASNEEPSWEPTPPDAFLKACQRQLQKGPQGDSADDYARTPTQAVLRTGRDRGPSYLL